MGKKKLLVALLAFKEKKKELFPNARRNFFLSFHCKILGFKLGMMDGGFLASLPENVTFLNVTPLNGLNVTLRKELSLKAFYILLLPDKQNALRVK